MKTTAGFMQGYNAQAAVNDQQIVLRRRVHPAAQRRPTSFSR